MKRILFARVFGIGNAVLSIPAIRHYRDATDTEVVVLVGTYPDDSGAREVLSCVPGVTVVTDREISALVRDLGKFDVAVGSMPYDGRWPLHEWAHSVVDCKPRPDPTTFGFGSWQDHEASYQLDTAKQLMGEHGLTNLKTDFWPDPPLRKNYVYLGVGRKYDAAGFWQKKHWGDENFIELTRLILDRHPEMFVIATGSSQDMMGTGRSMINALNSYGGRFTFQVTPIMRAVAIMNHCHSYIGNDTGMMHVAASMDKPVLAYFAFEGTERKNRPLCAVNRVVCGWREDSDPEKMYQHWREVCADHDRMEEDFRE